MVRVTTSAGVAVATAFCALAAAHLPAARSAHAPGSTPQRSAPLGWTLTWEDTFDGSQLNTSVWNVRTNESHCCGPFGGNGELELYVPEEVSVSGGALHLRTRKRSPPVRGPHGGEWNFTSGWVDTKGKWAQKYGRFEANCSLPGRDATGIWPAFWLMPESDQCWPTGGEVDIFEFNGNWLEDEIFGSYHWARAGQCGDDQAPIPGRGVKPTGAGSDWQTGWHVYAVEWFEDRLDFYLDDTLYFSKNSTEVVLPSAPMHVIFDQAVDSWLFPPSWGPGKYGDGVFLSVDYVRVYEATS